jgi:hypothetical protein
MPRGKSELNLPRAPGLKAEQQKALQKRVEEELKKLGAVEEYRVKALSRLVAYARKERSRIEGTDRKKLVQYRTNERNSRKKLGVWSPQQRMTRKVDFVRYAQSLGVETDEIFRLNAYTRLRAELLSEGPGVVEYKTLRSDPEGDSYDENCYTYTPPYLNTFSTSYSHASGDGQILASDSYLDANTAVCGGNVRIRNWDADDFDTGLAYQENGFTTCYKTKNAPGLVKVTAKFQCVASENNLSTEDEWGWSDSGIKAESYARFAVYLDTAGDLGFKAMGLTWSRYEGDGEPENNEAKGQILVTASPGQILTVSALSANVLPANTYVGIYVGTRAEVNFWVNDVSVDATALGKWLLMEIKVCQM